MSNPSDKSQPRRPFSGCPPPAPAQMQFREGDGTDTYREATAAEVALWLADRVRFPLVELAGRLWVRVA